MQYCPKCRIQIRGRKARCPLCQREVISFVTAAEQIKTGGASGLLSEKDGGENKFVTAAEQIKTGGTSGLLSEKDGGENKSEALEEASDAEDLLVREAGGLNVPESGAADLYPDGPDGEKGLDFASEDPFVQIPLPQFSSTLMLRCVAFLCVSCEIILGAFQVITGSSNGWVFAVMGGILIGWTDILLAVYYRNNIIRMLNTQAYVIMAACLGIDALTGGRGWAISWVVPSMFLIAVFATSAAGKAQKMELSEYILYPAFNVMMSLLQIIPIALGMNRVIAPAVICIAMMLILVSGLIIFRGRMLQDAAAKYLHI